MRPAPDPQPPAPEVEAALAYLTEKSPAGWRVDPLVERALIEAELLKWPGLRARLFEVLVDFLEHWTLIKPWKDRPHTTQGWRQAFRNWARIERERSERAVGAPAARPSAVSYQPSAGPKAKAPAARNPEDEKAAKAMIGELKRRMGWTDPKLTADG